MDSIPMTPSILTYFFKFTSIRDEALVQPGFISDFDWLIACYIPEKDERLPSVYKI